MQFPGELIILGLVIVFLLLFFAIGVENTIPAFVRTEFDAVASRYLMQLQTSGGIGPQQRNQLQAELNNLGFTNIQITAPENVVWGQEARLIITADYVIGRTKPDLTKENATLTATFDERTIVMTLNR